MYRNDNTKSRRPGRPERAGSPLALTPEGLALTQEGLAPTWDRLTLPALFIPSLERSRERSVEGSAAGPHEKPGSNRRPGDRTTAHQLGPQRSSPLLRANCEPNQREASGFAQPEEILIGTPKRLEIAATLTKHSIAFNS
ncbi:MAG: hypothetical protein WCD40_06035, partial [Candidatus Acidiferrales bacterium]